MGIKDEDRLEALRQRLYERGQPKEIVQPTHELTDEETPVATSWEKPPEPIKVVPTPEGVSDATLPAVQRKKTYRWKLVLIGIAFFVVSVVLSSFFLIQGGNGISGDNITIALSGPFTIGGGEAIPLQVAINNDNNVPINSATLIVEYPPGTQSTSDTGRELFTERLPLETIMNGETVNIPLRATVFGEENEEKEIKASIEYRVEGSNALFFKEAEPLRFKISSSPITVSIDNTVKLSSGQETEMTITINSNSPTPIPQILVVADYPNGFDYTESNPSPNYAENMWLIRDLVPEGSESITITGIMIGRETDEYAVNFSVGVPSERNPQELTSVFVTDRADFVIEQPFLDIQTEIANRPATEAAIEPGEQTSIGIVVTNTLEDTIYDISIIAELSGNALSDVDVTTREGFYNSSNNTIIWNVGNYDNMEQITPGQSENVTFQIRPDENTNRTPQIDVDIRVEARRVSESRVAERLEGTAKAVVKVLSIPDLTSDVGHNNGVFSDSGNIPPVAEVPTTYTLSMMVENGANEVTDTTVSASLPPYVTWLGESSGNGSLEFNTVNRILTWTPDNIEANDSAVVSFQVRFLPSQSQIGTTPTLLGQQRLRATDRFTGAVVRNEASALTTEQSSESGYEQGNGRVAAEAED